MVTYYVANYTVLAKLVSLNEQPFRIFVREDFVLYVILGSSFYQGV